MALMLTACGGGGSTGDTGAVGATGVAGAAGAKGVDGRTTLALVSQASTLICPTGGSKIEAGIDADGNGVLSSAEIANTQYVCNGVVGSTGANGAAGAAGIASLVTIVAEPAGAHCANGGSLVSVGADADGNGILAGAEVSSTAYVCAGAVGATGATGSTGATGAAGAAGATGASGAAGTNSLITIANDTSGTCVNGGKVIKSGLDANRNSVLDGGEVTTTTYVCNGLNGSTGAAGAAGANGQGINPTIDVTGTSMTAVANTAYVADNVAQVTFNLPASPSVGDVFRFDGGGSGGFRIAQSGSQKINTRSLPGNFDFTPQGAAPLTHSATSADGTVVIGTDANGIVYKSVDSGATFSIDFALAGVSLVHAVAVSPDGTKLFAASLGNGLVYHSFNGGAWVAGAQDVKLRSMAASADGSTVFGADGTIAWLSTDSGSTFSSVASGSLAVVAMTPDGQSLVAGSSANNGTISRSSDHGATWVADNYVGPWTSVALSADGSTFVGAASVAQNIAEAHNGFAFYLDVREPILFSQIAMSADGSRQIAIAATDARLYVSLDSGVTWSPRGESHPYTTIAISGDGLKMYANTNGGYLLAASIFGDTTTPGVTGHLDGFQHDSVQLEYVGNNMFMVIGFTSVSGAFVWK